MAPGHGASRGVEPLEPNPASRGGPRVGVLASQGDFAAQVQMLGELGATASEVRTREDLAGLDGLVIPGGESTAIMKAIHRDELEDGIRTHHAGGGALFGTCAGMIVADRAHLGLIDIECRRNAYGRQLQSFETELTVDGLGDDPLKAIFIRAPMVERLGDGVDVLATHEGKPVVVRQGSVLASAFHPELTEDSRLHALFMAMASACELRAGERSADEQGVSP